MWDTGQQEWDQIRSWSQNVANFSLPAMEEMFNWAAEQKANYDKYVVPAVQSMFSDAETYASKEEEMRQRGQAIQDVKAATEAQREAQLRKLEGFGIDPSETRYQALDKQAGVASAAAEALAANQAGERTKQIGRDLRAQAVQAGQNMGAQGLQAAQLGTSIGGNTLNSVAGASAMGSQIAQGALPYMQNAQMANNQAAGIVNTDYQNELGYTQAYNAAEQQDFNNMAGAAFGVATLPWGGIGKKVMGAADGGPVAAPGGPTSDAGAIAISDGEYVIPADVVRKMGTNYFDKMIEKETGRPPPTQKQAIPLDPNSAQYQPQEMARPMAGVIK
jgi:hypothetical protein